MYFKDFRKAVDNYLRGLESGSESVSLVEKALSGKPECRINLPVSLLLCVLHYINFLVKDRKETNNCGD